MSDLNFKRYATNKNISHFRACRNLAYKRYIGHQAKTAKPRYFLHRKRLGQQSANYDYWHRQSVQGLLHYRTWFFGNLQIWTTERFCHALLLLWRIPGDSRRTDGNIFARKRPLCLPSDDTRMATKARTKQFDFATFRRLHLLRHS